MYEWNSSFQCELGLAFIAPKNVCGTDTAKGDATNDFVVEVRKKLQTTNLVVQKSIFVPDLVANLILARAQRAALTTFSFFTRKASRP